MNERFKIICRTKHNVELVLMNGNTFIEKEADNIVRAHRGGVGESVGNHYFARRTAERRGQGRGLTKI